MLTSAEHHYFHNNMCTDVGILGREERMRERREEEREREERDHYYCHYYVLTGCLVL